jgi:hypothetical protein
MTRSRTVAREEEKSEEEEEEEREREEDGEDRHSRCLQQGPPLHYE